LASGWHITIQLKNKIDMKTISKTLKTALLATVAILAVTFTSIADTNNSMELGAMKIYVSKLTDTNCFKVVFNNDQKSPITVKILDIEGKELYKEVVKKNQTVYFKKFNMANIIGSRFILEISNSEQLTRKIVEF
jgi:hypothetical protein